MVWHMNDSIYHYVLAELASRKGTWPAIAADTDISLRTIEKIARREVKDPGVSRIESLARYFRALPVNCGADYNPNKG